MFLVHMEAGLMKVVQCLNRSWTCDSYFSLCKPTVQLINGRMSRYPSTHVVCSYTCRTYITDDPKADQTNSWLLHNQPTLGDYL